MTRTNDITRMAREAGFVGFDGDTGSLRRFATLVAVAEREACAKLIEARKTGANELMDAVRDMEARAIRARGTNHG